MTPEWNDVDFRLEFVAELLNDLERDRLADLGTYLEKHRGREREVAEEYLAFTRPEPEESAETRFKILEPLGRGGQATVYRAHDQKLKRDVALKILDSDLDATRAVERFRREAELASRLDHPGLCVVHDVGILEGRIFIAMRLVPGTTLARAISTSGTPDLARSLEILEKSARALHHAHEVGIVHRDIKPGNIMVDANDEPVILDFGLARGGDDEEFQRLTMTGDIFGTPSYMSPEQLRGRRQAIDRRTDVYSLGVTLFEAVTGSRPFEAPSTQELAELISRAPLPDPRRLNPKISEDLKIVIETAMERDVERRYATAEALADDLERVRLGEPILARPVGRWLKTVRWAKRNPMVAGLLFLILTTSLVGYVQESRLRRRADADRQIAERLSSERAEALAEVLRLSDSREILRLLGEDEALWPAHPDTVEPRSRWMREADELLSRENEHRAMRLSLEKGQLDISSEEREWLENVLDDVLVSLERLRTLREEMGTRQERASTIVKRSISDHEKAWRECIERVKASELYGGLELPPQVGLVPLGPCVRTDLEEFWVVESGERPTEDVQPWDEDEDGWIIAPETGIVLVLIPGGTFTMGEQSEGFNVPKMELPVHEITLAPFFLSKYELTQAQWMRIDRDNNPSYFRPGCEGGRDLLGFVEPTLSHPVESFSWDEGLKVIARLGLTFPTEAQWEYSCKAGTTTLFHTGMTEASLRRFANFFGEEQPPERRYSTTGIVHDGILNHGPVGRLRPNPFGMHDMHGNIAEQTLDTFIREIELARPAPGSGLLQGDSADPLQRVRRGGSWYRHPLYGRSAARNWANRKTKNHDFGVRPARKIIGRE